MGAVKNYYHDEISGKAGEYRGLEIWHENPPIPFRGFDYIAIDPDSDGEAVAYGRTIDDCKFDIDRYLGERDQ